MKEKNTVTINELKVSSKSKPNSVAGAIVGALKEKPVVEIDVVGAGALNQAIKAVAIARGFLAPSGQDVSLTPAFRDIEIQGESRTAMRLFIEKR
jgi:stage V sporulation protein S